MAMPGPAWKVYFPWSITLPTDRPLGPADLKGHDEILPGHGPHDQCLRIGNHPGNQRFVLPYLIPQSHALTSRLIFGWAFVAPLVQIADLSVAIPLVVMRRMMPEYDPLTQVVIPPEVLVNEYWYELFHPRSAVPCVWKNRLCVVLRIRDHDVAVAPTDTPVHHYNASFYSCCIP